MRTYITNLIPKIKEYSQKLDNLTILMNQHWVIVDEIKNTKSVYIFRNNKDLLISQNGIVEKAKWEYLGNDALLIEKDNQMFLYKHGFFDENVLALKVDGKNEYAFLINENKYEGELNSFENIIDFLDRKYIQNSVLNIGKRTKSSTIKELEDRISPVKNKEWNMKELEGDWTIKEYNTIEGSLIIRCLSWKSYLPGDKVFINRKPAKDGKYDLDWYNTIEVKNGEIV